MNEETDWDIAIPESTKTLAGLLIMATPLSTTEQQMARLRQLINITWKEAQLVERMKLCRLD